MITTLINPFLEEFEMQEFTTNPRPGHTIFTFTGNREVNLFEFDTCFALKAVIGPMPKQKVDAVLSKIMDANLYGKGARGAVIGCELNQLVLSLELPKHISYPEFRESLENFLNDLDRLAIEYK